MMRGVLGRRVPTTENRQGGDGTGVASRALKFAAAREIVGPVFVFRVPLALPVLLVGLDVSKGSYCHKAPAMAKPSGPTTDERKQGPGATGFR